MPHASLAGYIEKFLRYGRDIAFVDRKGYRTVRWTYPQVAEAAAQVARELERLGVQKGDRAVLWGDCGEWIAAFYGCVLRGVVAVPLDRIASPEFARTVTQQVRARVAFGPRENMNHLETHIFTCAHYLGVEESHLIAIDYQEFDDARHRQSVTDAFAAIPVLVHQCLGIDDPDRVAAE